MLLAISFEGLGLECWWWWIGGGWGSGGRLVCGGLNAGMERRLSEGRCENEGC